MQTLVYINPLKPGKLDAYRAFSAENIGPRKAEYMDLLKRYGLKNAKVYYHRLAGKEFIVVVHDAEDDAVERLTHFNESNNPYDQWFLKQLVEFHDFNTVEGNQAEQIFNFPESNFSEL